jgi:lipoate-protein ligase A
MKLYNLGKIPWDESQLIYHALAALGREALSLVSPATPYVCIGFHQDADQEVDLNYCEAHHIPVFRRDLGGGAVYLDGNQLFYQLILRKDNPIIPARKEAFYRKFLQPVIHVYRRLGISAQYKPINDVIVDTRKISGSGVGEMGECIVLVGNLIVDFNYKAMSRVLKVPDEKFRDKIHKTLVENLSTIRRELGEKEAESWSEADLNGLMVEEFEKILGPMQSQVKDNALQAKMDELGARLMTYAWLHKKGREVHGRDIKIRAGIRLVHKMHKAAGGLMRADFEVIEGKFGRVLLSGDFFCYPEEGINRLELWLQGHPLEEVRNVLTDFYSEAGIETPGIEIDDWLLVLSV